MTLLTHFWGVGDAELAERPAITSGYQTLLTTDRHTSKIPSAILTALSSRIYPFLSQKRLTVEPNRKFLRLPTRQN